MNISSVFSNPLPNIQSLQSYLTKQVKSSSPAKSSASADINAVIARSMQDTQGSSSAQSTPQVDPLSMLQALMGYNSVNSTDPLFDALNETNTDDNSQDMTALLNMAGSPISANPYVQQLQNLNSNNDLLSMYQSIQGTTPGNAADNYTPFDSNSALLRALQSSGMSDSRVAEIFNQVQISSQYNQQGNVSSAADYLQSGYFSATA